jgi:UDP-N-acetylmuramoyl-tripeptide--D-alanyl-D-alanine ligase
VTPPTPLTLADLAEATGGLLTGGSPDQSMTGVFRTDNRTIQPGDVFLALQGETFDGHDFVDAALTGGAVAAVVQRGAVVRNGAGADPVGPLVEVEDTVAAAGRLASLWLGRWHPAVIGVTGSSGKTSTKDILGQVLATAGETVVPSGSLNNEVGVPQTAFLVRESTRYLVVEMGAKGVGHIRYLCDMVHPTIGVVLNVGHAHVGEFGGVDAIAAAKGELVEALPVDGVAVLNADDARVLGMAARTRAAVATFGRGELADVRADDVRLDPSGRASFRLAAAGGEADVTLAFSGEHMVSNALAAASVGLAVGLAVDQVAAALTAATPKARWRMEITERPDGVTVVNDAYNANPDSMRAALVAHAHIGEGRRRVAVLGEMLELGDEADAAHREVGRLAVELRCALVVVVGAGAAGIAVGARAAGATPATEEELPADGGDSAGTVVVSVADSAAASTVLGAVLRPGDAVLVKSSRDAGLRWLGDDLAGERRDSAG